MKAFVEFKFRLNRRAWRDSPSYKVRIFQPEPRHQVARVGAAEKDPFIVGQIVFTFEKLDEIGHILQDLLSGEVFQIGRGHVTGKKVKNG